MKKKSLLLVLVLCLVMLVGCGSVEEKELTPISEEMIEITIETLNEADDVLDSHIEVKDDKIIIAIITDVNDKEYAKLLGEEAVKLFGDIVAMNSDLIGSTDESYGEIYNEYAVSVAVGTSADNILAQGYRIASDKTELKISW